MGATTRIQVPKILQYVLLGWTILRQVNARPMPMVFKCDSRTELRVRSVRLVGNYTINYLGVGRARGTTSAGD